MNYIINTFLIGLFFGTFGTTVGGIIGVTINKNSNKFLSTILSFASGLMISIVCFDLIPEAMKLANILNIIIGILFGIVIMIICDIFVQKKINKRDSVSNNSLLKTGIIVSIGLAIHNFPEGLAIGSGFGASIVLGYSLAVAICLHDIPEGISMAIPLKSGGISKLKVIAYVILSGVTTGIGAFLGAIVGEISQHTIALCLSFSAGAMLYIVSGELIPESNKLYSGKWSTVANMLGIIIGLIVININ
ncbi:MAG: ZIP family metal transporter [Clostridia bacterium]|nr:ZIP family metal transporter [Clostridia bacterium]